MKTKHLFFIALFFVLLINLAKAQHGNVWVYGIGNTLDFNQSPPVDAPQRPMQAFEGSAVACDSLGNLLFYTNGITVYDKNDQIMPNGDSLKGGSSASMAAQIVPWPGHSKKYFVITVAQQGEPDGFCYSVVDLALNNGLGEVTTKNVQLHPSVGEKLTVTKHCNGIDYWVFVRTALTNQYLSFLISVNGIDSIAVVSQAIPARPHTSIHDNSVWGQFKFSPDSKFLAESVRRQGLFIYSFNAQTGMVTGLLNCDTSFASNWGNPIGVSNWGVSFDNTSEKLVYSVGQYTDSNNSLQFCNCIFEYSSTDGFVSFVRRDLVMPDSIPQINGMQLAPDNNIYVKVRKQGPNGVSSYGEILRIETATAINGNLPLISELNYPQNLGPFDIYGISFPSFYDGIFTNHHKAALKIPLCNPTGGFDSIPFFDSLLTTTHPYHWNFGDPASGAANESTEQFPVHYFTGPGVYTVTLSLESDCTPLQITQQVTVTQQTPLQPQISNTLGTLECTPAFSYQWYMNGMLISGATLQQFTPSQVGNYWVVISDASGCNAQSEPYGYWILGQVAQAQNNFLRIYPNPASDFVFMDASDHGNWMLYDISGKLCLTGHANKGPNRIILKDLQKGMYVLRAGEKVARLVVE
jgi:hypothetical protein